MTHPSAPQVVVVSNDLSLADSIRVDEFCHRSGIPFCRAEIRGVFASVFCDFGPAFNVLDVDGEWQPPVLHSG